MADDIEITNFASLNRVLGRIETKVDDLRTYKDDHEKRVTALERWRNIIVGGAAVVGFAASYLFKKGA